MIILNNFLYCLQFFHQNLLTVFSIDLPNIALFLNLTFFFILLPSFSACFHNSQFYIAFDIWVLDFFIVFEFNIQKPICYICLIIENKKLTYHIFYGPRILFTFWIYNFLCAQFPSSVYSQKSKISKIFK